MRKGGLWKTTFENSYWISSWKKETIWGFRKDDRKRNGQPITISTLRFENLTTALDDLNSQSSKALDFVWITLLSPFLLHALSSDWRNDSAQKTESSLAVAQHKSMDSKLSILQSCSDGYFNNTYSYCVILLLVLLQPKLLL